MLDSRVVTSSGELIEALQDYLVMEGERSEGQVAVFKRQAHGHENSGSSGSSEKKVAGACFKCGKPGHKAADCWQKSGVGSSSVNEPNTGVSGKPIVCYTCGEEGHKSTQCSKGKKVNPKEGQAKPVRLLWHREGRNTVVDGNVNGKSVSVLLDSGASISVVPEEMVEKELRTGEYVAL